MNSFKRIIIVSATSAIAEHCAYQWAKANPVEFTLIGRDLKRLGHVRDNIQQHNPQARLDILRADFFDPVKIQTLANTLAAKGPIDLVLIAQGFLPAQHDCQTDLTLCRDTLTLTAISPALYAEAFANVLEKQGHGTLAVIGSVASDRARRSLYVYGAAKSLLAHYIAGLQHRFARTKVRCILIKPGPTATPMTADAPDIKFILAPVELVARQIVAGIARGQAVIYTPPKWRFIMWIARLVPDFLFHRFAP